MIKTSKLLVGFMAAAGVWLAFSESGNAQDTFSTGSRAWFTFTGENGTDYLELTNWRYAGGGTAAQPSGGGYTGPYGHPTSLNSLLTRRHEIGASIWNPPSGGTLATTTVTPVGRAVIDGNSASYIARNAAVGGVGIRQTYGSGVEFDGGVTLEIINGAKYSLMSGGLAGQTGAATGFQALDSNGYDTSPKQDYDAWFANNASTVGGVHRGNSLRNTVYVTSGGTFEVGRFRSINANSPTPIGTINIQGDGGIHASGHATVSVNGDYEIGGGAAVTTGSGKGGGFLTLQGYNAASSIRIGTGSNVLLLNSAITTTTPSARLTNWSQPAELKAILDSTNNGGMFNTAVADTLRIRPNGSGDPVLFNIEVNGYTPVVGHVFPIITATTLSDGTDTGVLGAMSRQWNTDFIVGTTQFKLLQSYTNPDTSVTSNGVFLEVTAVAVPEPGAVGLLAAAGGLAAAGWYRRRR